MQRSAGKNGSTIEECRADVSHFWKVLQGTMGKWQPATASRGMATNERAA